MQYAATHQKLYAQGRAVSSVSQWQCVTTQTRDSVCSVTVLRIVLVALEDLPIVQKLAISFLLTDPLQSLLLLTSAIPDSHVLTHV